MPDLREVILGATLEAERLHKELESEERLRRFPGSVDGLWCDRASGHRALI